MNQIVTFPDLKLRKKAKGVVRVDEKLKKQVRQLAKMLETSENGAGLAGPQIGISRRFFGVKKGEEVAVLINPKIVKKEGEKKYLMINKDDGSKEYFLEGCLSFPGFYGRVKRWLKIEAEWQELRQGKLVDKKGKLTDFEAVVFQHESDHLDGVLFVDMVKNQGGKFFKWQAGGMEKYKVGRLLMEEKEKKGT